MSARLKWRGALASFVATAALAAFGVPAGAQAPSGQPITIGFGMALTGPLAANGKQALLGAKIWEETINKKGGLLGRPVKLVYYDDQSNPSTVPGIYTKLLDVDKVDLVTGPYATAMIAPAMPVVMQKGKVFIGLFGLAVNSEFNYPKYFAMIPSGPETKPSFTKGFFEVAAQQNPKPQTVALVAADQEFSRNACEGARENAKAAGLRVVYDKTYPPTTTDFSPIVRAIQATNPDIVSVCSYPLDSVGMVKAVNEIGFKPKMIGGAMVGLQATVFKTQLGPLLNGWVNYETWVPSEKMLTPEVKEFLASLSVARGGRRRRSARLLSRHLGLCLYGAARQCDRRCEEHQRRSGRQLSAQQSGQDHHGRHQVRQGWRVGGVAHAAGAVSRHQGQHRRPVQGHGHPDGVDAGRPEDRQRHLSLREGEIVRREHQVADGPGCVAASGTGNVGLREDPERRGIFRLATIALHDDHAQM